MAAPSFRSAHFGWKHRAVAALSRRFDRLGYTQRRGLARGFQRRGGLGFVPELRWAERSAERRFFEQLELRGRTVFDIGGFEGLMAMFFSRDASRVVCYEPNPRSRERIAENLALNAIENVLVRDVGVGEASSRVSLHIDPLMPGGASADREIGDQIAGEAASVEVEIDVVRLDDDIAASALPDPDFIKVDIEGLELAALRGMRRTLERCRPALFLEMHGACWEQKRRNAAAIVDFLVDHGYPRIVHVESGSLLASANSEIGARGHLYCEAW